MLDILARLKLDDGLHVKELVGYDHGKTTKISKYWNVFEIIYKYLWSKIGLLHFFVTFKVFCYQYCQDH